MTQETDVFAIADNESRIQEIASFTGQFSFAFPFELFEPEDIEVYLTPVGQQGNPTADLLSLNNDYTITPTVYPIASGNVILAVPATLGDIITMNRAVPNSRNTAYEVAGKITGKELDTDFDRIIAMIQQLNTLLLNQGLTYEVTDFLVDRSKDNILPKLPAKSGDNIPIWSKNADGKLIAAELEENADASTLRSELASQDITTPGSGLVGYYDDINAIGRTLTEQLDLIMEGLPSTGDIKVCFKLVADTSWVLMDDGTIGNAVSGATTRANADTLSLFTLLWDNTDDANCPVLPGGRGASAIDDFNANKTINLPLTIGRALTNNFIPGLKGLNGVSYGSATSALSVANMPSHSHGVTDPGHTHDLVISGIAGVGPVARSAGGAQGIMSTLSKVTGVSIDSAGSGTQFSTQSPSVLCTLQIKL